MPDPTVFIASTSEDLKTYRLAARDSAMRCRFGVRMMETFTAGSNPPLSECRAAVDQADLLIVIVAHRFGWIPDEQDATFATSKSITWLEVDHALEEDKIDVLAFLVDDDYDWSPELREEYRVAQAMVDGKLTQK